MTPKVFVIGFNKCGTKSLHKLFTLSGYASLHCRYRQFGLFGPRIHAARTLKANLERGRPLLTGLNRFQIFSDLIYLSDTEVIDANRFFKQMHAQHPDAYFIFNDRPLDAWIRSRLNHDGARNGSFVERYQALTGQTQPEVEALWRATYTAHKAEVLDYFAENPRFVHFDITTDRPERLAAALAPDFTLDTSQWGHHGSATERRLRQAGQFHRAAGARPDPAIAPPRRDQTHR